MSDYSELTKFIPALTVERIGEWVMDGDTPRVEYWDVVFRFCDAVEAFCENTTLNMQRRTPTDRTG